jgi:hypothetical protein
MKIWILALIASFQLFAFEIPTTRNVVLLTSLKHDRINIEYKLERIFRHKLRKYPFELKVIHSAGITELRNELTNPSNDAVFWVSHGAFNKSRDSVGMTQKPMLLTHDYKNIAPLFGDVDVGIQYLGIIGCNTKNIINYYHDNSENDNLMSYISKGKTIAQFGLRRALRRFKRAWRRAYLKESNKEQQDSVSIQITRTANDHELPALIIENSLGFIDVLPRQAAGTEMTYNLNFPISSESLVQDFNVLVKTGISPFVTEKSEDFGNIEITYNDERKWKLFAKPSGEAFGNNSRLYIYNGVLEDF